MHIRLRTALAAILLATAGCGSSEPSAPPPPAVKDTVFGDMAGTMDKARGVQDVVQQQKEATDKAIENSAGAASP